MFRLITLITLVSVLAGASAYSQRSIKTDNRTVVVVKTMDGKQVKGLLSELADGSLTVMKLNGNDTTRQTIEAQAIEWVKYRKKRSALANSALFVGAVAAAGLSTAAWTAKPIGASELTTGNVVVGVATAATSLFLISRLVKGLPRTLRINGNPAIFADKKIKLLR